MKLIVLGFALFCCFFTEAKAAKETVFFKEAKHGKGELKYVNRIPVLFLQGTPEEMGEQHGVLLGGQIEPFIELPQKVLNYFQAAPLWPAVVMTGNRLAKNLEPHHQKELAKFIEKSKLDKDKITVANSILELRRMGGCSTFVVPGNKSKTGDPIFGRNFDFPTLGTIHKYSLIVVARPKGKRSYVSVSFPGLLGVISGMNDSGLTIATLDVYQSNDGSPPLNINGSPMTFCYRRILEECKDVPEAIALMKKMKATTWMNLTICDRKESAVLEITPKNVIVRRSKTGFLSCTNHFRTPPLGWKQNDPRFRILNRRRGKNKLGIKEVAKELHRVSQGTLTIQTMIFEPKTLKLHLAIGKGPTSKKKLIAFEMAKYLSQKEESKTGKAN